MTKLDNQIRQIVGEIVDSAPVVDSMPLRQAGTDRDVRRSSQRHRILVGAAVAVAVFGIGFLAVGPGDGPTGDGVAATESADTSETEPPAPLSDRQWPYPQVLPDGYEFDYAMRSVPLRQVRFISADESSSLGVAVIEVAEGADSGGGTGGSIELGGTTWYEHDDGGRYVQAGGNIEVWFDEGMDRETAHAVLASIEILEQQALPRPPLPSLSSGPFTEVASAEMNGTTDRLSADTDGKYYITRTLGSGGCCTTLADDEAIVLSGGVWPDTEVGTETEGDGLLQAIVGPSVATVQINLKDGSTIIAEPQDTNDSFPVNFIFTKIPVRGDELLSQVDVILALDEDGNELERLTGDDLDY